MTAEIITLQTRSMSAHILQDLRTAIKAVVLYVIMKLIITLMMLETCAVITVMIHAIGELQMFAVTLETFTGIPAFTGLTGVIVQDALQARQNVLNTALMIIMGDSAITLHGQILQAMITVIITGNA